MSKNNDKNSFTQRITRNTVKNNPELKDLIIDSQSAFNKSRKTPRSPNNKVSFDFDDRQYLKNNFNEEPRASTSTANGSFLDNFDLNLTDNLPVYLTPTEANSQKNILADQLLDFVNKKILI